MIKYIVSLFLVILLSTWGQDIKAGEMLDFSGRTLIIDVRTTQEYKIEHLKNAINIPLNEIEKKITEIVTDYNETIILYCKSGGRAEMAKRVLEKMGYKNVINAGSLSKLQNMLNKELLCEGC